MACERPKKIVNPRYRDFNSTEKFEYARETWGLNHLPPDYILEVPCGYCYSCQKSVNNQYRIRLMYEIRRWSDKSCLFVTLTFDDPFLRRFESDPNRAVRLFLDRMRKRYGKQIRHWFIGEYGTLHGRVHYHGILFNVPPELRDCGPVTHPGDHLEIRSAWSYGHVFVGYVNDKTCSYITKYLTKSINGEKVRPRVITSKGIGENYLESEDAALHKAGGKLQPLMHLNGFPQAMPRYYYNKIFTDFDKQNMVLDRYLDPPPPSWQGVAYPTVADRNAARAVTHDSNVNSGLTPAIAPPARPRGESRESRFKKLIDRNPQSQISIYDNGEETYPF